MAPPQLAAYAPVLDVLQPVAIGVLELLGMELDCSVLYNLKSLLGDITHLHKPLSAELGLYHRVGTFRMTNLVHIVFYLFNKASLLKVLHNGLAASEAVHTGILATIVVEGAVVVKDVDTVKAVFHTQIVVVDVVGRRNLKGASTEFAVNILVHNDGHHAADAGHNHFLAFQPLVALVFGMHAHCRIAHIGLRTRGSDNNILVFTINEILEIE